MSNLFTSMSSAAGAMSALERSLSAVQNNIANAATAGYARQEGSLVANSYNPNSGSMSGGVSAGAVRTTRNGLLEASVWKSQHRTGFANGLSTRLGELERTFSLAEGAGLSGQLDKFFSAVSQWSLSPNQSTARRQVLDGAGAVAASFRQTALELGDAGARAGADLTAMVRTINRLTADIAAINAQRRDSVASTGDAGLDANLHAKLEELSRYVEFTALPQEDGSVSVFLGGQTPAVIGDRHWSISVTNSGGAYQLLDASGAEITGRFGSGTLAAAITFHNELLPDYRNRLNAMAQGFAGAVNATLNAGIDQNGAAPVKNLFTYDTVLGAAATLAVTDITVAELAAALPGDPGGNTNALNLADLQNSPFLAGLTPAQSYADLASAVGSRLNTEKSNGTLQRQLLLQAQNVRAEFSGVDINAEATKLMQLQKGFQASGQVMAVLNSLTETIINLIR
jgi:flagellar hook-associated protein 1